MKITCQSCAAKYSIADDRIAGRRVKIRCKRCGDEMVLGSSLPAPTLELFVLVDGDQRGPLTVADVRALASTGEVDADTLGWHASLADWSPLSAIAELGPLPRRSASTFDAPDDSPFAADDGDVVASPVTPRATPMATTGARNESSLLFSLANLQGLAGAPSTSRAAPARSTAHASGEGSGLIDIRALSLAVAPTTPRTSSPSLDLVLGVGTPALLSPLAAPVILPTPRRRSGSRVLTAAAAVAAAMALMLGGFALASLTRSSAHAALPPAPLELGPRPPTVEPPLPPSDVVAPPIEVASVEPPAAGTTPEAPADPSRPRVRVRPPAEPHVAMPVVDEPTVDEPAVPASGHRSLDDLIRGSITPTEEPRVRADASRVALPETPSRDAVRAAMTALEPAIRACAAGTHGRALVSVVVGGENGRGRSATVGGDFSGTEAGSCIARAARGVELAPFSRTTFTIAYPFAL